jgi:phage baseplate assembly protein W
MAYRQQQINPLDLKPSTGIGLKIPFSEPYVFQSVYTTAEQIKYNITNFLLTGRRERVFEPTFGSGLQDLVFEAINDENLSGLEVYIKSTVEGYFPNVEVTAVKVAPFHDSNQISVTFTYNIRNTGQSDEVLLNFQNG